MDALFEEKVMYSTMDLHNRGGASIDMYGVHT